MIGHLVRIIKGLKIKSILKEMKKIGENVQIEYGEFNIPENMILGSHIYIGPGAQMSADGGLIIEDGVIFGPKCVIYTSSHNYDSEDLKSVPYDGKTVVSPVRIKKNTWIGGQSIILPGVTIGEGCVVSAGSIVTKDVEDFAVVGGNPAKILKYRNKERYKTLAASGQIYLKKKICNEIKYEMVDKDRLIR